MTVTHTSDSCGYESGTNLFVKNSLFNLEVQNVLNLKTKGQFNLGLFILQRKRNFTALLKM